MSMSRGTLSLKDFKIQNEIGRGGFGMVYLVKGLKAGYKDKHYALKEIPNVYGSKNNEERIRSEIEALTTLNEQNSPDRQKIVTFYGSFVEDGKTYILMEYCQYGSLRKYISKHGPLDNHKAADVMSQLIQGIRFIHKCKIAHRDLTTGNVLIYDKREDGNLCVKIADFGLTKTVPKRPAPQTCVGTPGYIAWEMINGKAYNESADVFSLGAILYMMLVGEDPETITQYAEDGRPIFKNGRFQRLDADARELICSLMCKAEGRLRLDAIHSQGFIHRSLSWVQQMRGTYPRSGSTDQRPAIMPRRTSGDGAGDPRSDRYSSGAAGPARRRGAASREPSLQPPASVPLPSAQLPLPDTARARYQRAAASNDSAFGSQEPLHRRSRSRCPHTGVSYGSKCSVCEAWVIDRRYPMADRPTHGLQPAAPLVRRPSAGAEDRAPSAARSLPPSAVVVPSAAKASRASSNGSAVLMAAPHASESYKWPIPYPHYFARWHANVSGRYVRNNDYGRFIVTGGSISPKVVIPDVIFEMKGERGVVQLVFRVYWCCEPGKRQVVRVQRPIRTGVIIQELTDPEVERDSKTSIDYKSLDDLLRTPDPAVRTGYQRIFQFVNLARYKLPRRTVRNILPGVNVDVRYDGTITMALPDDRPLVEIKRNGKAKNMEHLKENERLVFNLVQAELSAFHEVMARAEADNLPADTKAKLDVLRIIMAHSEILRTWNTEAKIAS